MFPCNRKPLYFRIPSNRKLPKKRSFLLDGIPCIYFFDLKKNKFRYKKNIKKLIVVHPTSWMKTIWTMIRPLISMKFGRKLTYVNNLSELEEWIWLNQISIPADVKNFDKSKLADLGEARIEDSSTLAPQSQFGVELDILISKQGTVPQIPNELVTFLGLERNIQTEGIFRRSASNQQVRDSQAIYNQGKSPIDQFLDPILPAGKFLYNFVNNWKTGIFVNNFKKLEFPSIIEKLEFSSIIEKTRISVNNWKTRILVNNLKKLEFPSIIEKLEFSSIIERTRISVNNWKTRILVNNWKKLEFPSIIEKLELPSIIEKTRIFVNNWKKLEFCLRRKLWFLGFLKHIYWKMLFIFYLTFVIFSAIKIMVSVSSSAANTGNGSARNGSTPKSFTRTENFTPQAKCRRKNPRYAKKLKVTIGIFLSWFFYNFF